MDLKTGDLCWAKMKGWPPWPGKITKAPLSDKSRYQNKKKLHRYIYFFGPGNYAWVPVSNIEPNSDEIIHQSSKKKSTSLQKAILLLKECMTSCSTLEENYYRQGIIKKCSVKLSPLLNSNIRLLQSDPLCGNVSSCELNPYEVGEPQRQIRNIDSALIPDTESVTGSYSKYQKLQSKKFGFIGRGELQRTIVKNLLMSKSDVTVFNQNCKDGLNNSHRKDDSFLNLIDACDIILCCICSEGDVLSILKGDHGILRGFANCQSSGKGLVIVTNIDLQIYTEITTSIQTSGSRYIGAHFLGPEMEFVDRDLLFLCSGNESLFHDCKDGFASFKRLKYVGPDIELALKLYTVIGLFFNSISRSYSEAKSLIREFEVSVQTFDDVLKTLLNESSFTSLCNNPLERPFMQEDRIKFFSENLNLKTLLAANFPVSVSNTH